MIERRARIRTAVSVIVLIGGWSIAAAQSAAPASAAGNYRVLHGPGGKELIEVPMPEGFKPIRLIGLGGLPVAGYPVNTTSGELNPQNWEQLDLGDIDVHFDRTLAALLLRSKPKLLQGMSFAESFARANLEEETAETWFATPKSSQFGENEFQRKQRFDEFLARYAEPLRTGLPGLPFELMYIEEVNLGAYDHAAGALPLVDGAGEANSVRLRGIVTALSRLNTPRVPVPAAVPMTPAQAEALLARIPDARGPTLHKNLPPIRHVYWGLRLAVTGFAVNKNGRTQPQIEVRSVALFEDPLLTRRIHQYVVEEQESEGPTELTASLLLPYMPNLYAMRDLDGYLDDEGIAHSSGYLIGLEQTSGGALAIKRREQLCKEKLTTFEWAAASVELANGPLLDVLMEPAADWTFLNDATRFGLVPDHCVEVRVFPPDKIKDRQVEFVAGEMAPVYRRSLEAAIARLPGKIYINKRLPAPTYDHANQVLVFDDPAATGYGNLEGPAQLLTRVPRGVEFLAPGETPKSSSAYAVRAPQDAEGLAFYVLPGEIGGNERITPVPMKPKSMDPAEMRHGQAWRTSVRMFRGERNDDPYALAVDRLVLYPRIPADPATAERLVGELSDYNDVPRAIVVLAVDGVRRVDPAQRGILFARLDRVIVTTHDGREVAVLDAASFPDAMSAYRQGEAGEQAEKDAAAQAAAAKKAAKESSLAEAKAAREAGLAACDSSSSTAGERLACYRNFCKSRQGDYECSRQVQYAQTAANTEKALAAGRSATQRSSCKMRARRKWRLTEASEHYAGVVDNCLAQTERAVYGPDILGLRLGMQKNDADLIRRSELDIRSGQMRRAETGLFDEGTIYFSEDKNHLLAIYNLDNLGNPVAAVIGRRIHFGREGEPVASLLKPMVGKYGSPVWRDDRHILWTFAPDGESKSGASSGRCGKLAALLMDSTWGGMGRPDEEISKIAPPTISEQGRADYSALADCGVVLIARLGWLPNGAVGDASLVMFDPAWIAEQPDIAFADPAEKKSALEF